MKIRRRNPRHDAMLQMENMLPVASAFTLMEQ
jgi:hypothetical protein